MPVDTFSYLKICEERSVHKKKTTLLFYYIVVKALHETSLLTGLSVYNIVLLSIGTMLYSKPLKLTHFV